jgi:hypothetical protein
MSQNPINLAVRFLLEVAALFIMGYWGWQQGDGFIRYVWMLAIPIVAAALWGTFRVPGDPGDAPVAVPGLVRLLLELAYFGFSIWALFSLGEYTLAWIFGVILLIHYVISYDRVRDLLIGRPGQP